jgi:predicted amidohydrolase
MNHRATSPNPQRIARARRAAKEKWHMPRHLKIAAAQMGPNNEGTSREEIVERMLGLLAEAAREHVELIVYPEMALTTYFPKKIRQDFDQFFETEVPPKALEPLLRQAAEARVAVHVGFCEKADGKYFNSALLTDRDGRLCGTFRKIHLPGTRSADGFAQVFEPYYFAHGDTGYKVFDAAGAKVGIAICQDRRYPESYRALALEGAEVIVIGYNTPLSPLALDLNELCMRSGAYANACFVVGVAKAGVEDGVELIGGSAIINPLGQVLAKAATTGDELVVARVDLDQMTPVRKRWNFLGRRQPQHYGTLLQPVTDKEPHR